VLGFGADGGESRGTLQAFDENGPYDKPLWTSSVDYEQLPSGLRNRNSIRRQFSVFCGWVLDVFPENPGKEIVVVFANEFSQRALRIYGLDGSILYQVWQDGGVNDIVWHEGLGALIISGAAEDSKWRVPGASQVNTLFALRPKFKYISREFLTNAAGEGPLDPVWIRYFHPPVNDNLNWTALLSPNSESSGASSHTRVHINLTTLDYKTGAHLTFLVDEMGQEVRSTREVNDGYIKHSDQSPPIEVFQLRDDPPTKIWQPLTASTDAASQSRPTGS